MRFRRDAAPPLLDAEHGDAGALRGAAIVGLDAAITETGLAQWAVAGTAA